MVGGLQRTVGDDLDGYAVWKRIVRAVEHLLMRSTGATIH